MALTPFDERLATGPVSCEEAREIAERYNRSHFRERTPGERARYSIPADPKRDDDIRLLAFIDQAQEAEAALTLLRRESATREAEVRREERERACRLVDGLPASTAIALQARIREGT